MYLFYCALNENGSPPQCLGGKEGKMAAAASSKTKVVLLGCGCFNPITHMHLRMFGRLFPYYCIN